MPESIAEQVLKALHMAISISAPPGVAVYRNESLPDRLPAGGMLNIRDGVPDVPAVTLSPLRYHYQHRAEIEALVSGANATERDAAFDALRLTIGSALQGNRTLGGLCDWTEAEAPESQDVIVDGAPPVKSAVIPVILHYSTADPLA